MSAAGFILPAQRWTVDPLSPRLKYWDVFILLSMAYTAFVTPFEVSFLDDDTAGDGLFVCNRIIDTIFISDIILVFFLPFRAPVSKGGVWVYSSKKIAKNYLKGWFLLDFISSFPFDLIVRGTDGGSANGPVRVRPRLPCMPNVTCDTSGSGGGRVRRGPACPACVRLVQRAARRASPPPPPSPRPPPPTGPAPASRHRSS